MSKKVLKVLSFLMVITLLLQVFTGVYPFSIGNAVVKSPEVRDGHVTFRYEGEATTVKVAGSFTDWESGALALTEKEGGIWELTKELPAGTYEYKFIVDGKWLTDSSNPNSRNGNSLVSVKNELIEINSPVINEDGSITFNYASNGESNLYLIGNFVDWDLTKAYEMTEKDGIFSITIPELEAGEYQYKFIKNNRNWNESITDPQNPNTKDGNSVFTIEKLMSPVIHEDGNVTFHYKKSSETAVYLVGSFNNWDVTSAVEMTEKDGVFSTTLSDLKPGTYEYKFLLNNRSWDKSTTDPLNDKENNGNSVFTIDSPQPITVQSALMDAKNEILVTTNKPFENQRFTLVDKEANKTLKTTLQTIDEYKAKLIVDNEEDIDVQKIYEVSIGDSLGTKVMMI